SSAAVSHRAALTNPFTVGWDESSRETTLILDGEGLQTVGVCPKIDQILSRSQPVQRDTVLAVHHSFSLTVLGRDDPRTGHSRGGKSELQNCEKTSGPGEISGQRLFSFFFLFPGSCAPYAGHISTLAPWRGFQSAGVLVSEGGLVPHSINTTTFAARDFWPRRGASDEHTLQWSVRSEQRSLGQKEPPPGGLGRFL